MYACVWVGHMGNDVVCHVHNSTFDAGSMVNCGNSITEYFFIQEALAIYTPTENLHQLYLHFRGKNYSLILKMSAQPHSPAPREELPTPWPSQVTLAPPRLRY